MAIYIGRLHLSVHQSLLTYPCSLTTYIQLFQYVFMSIFCNLKIWRFYFLILSLNIWNISKKLTTLIWNLIWVSYKLNISSKYIFWYFYFINQMNTFICPLFYIFFAKLISTCFYDEWKFNRINILPLLSFRSYLDGHNKLLKIISRHICLNLSS